MARKRKQCKRRIRQRRRRKNNRKKRRQNGRGAFRRSPDGSISEVANLNRLVGYRPNYNEYIQVGRDKKPNEAWRLWVSGDGKKYKKAAERNSCGTM